jgi:sulfur-oxidizing protein SoxY
MSASVKPRRAFMAANAALLSVTLIRPGTLLAADTSLAALVRAYAGETPVQTGRVRIQIATLVDNGNSVPIEVSVESPMTAADHVIGIAIFNEKNPEHSVAEFTLSPSNGRARVATRMRLAMTQKIIAVAKMQDGRCWMETVDVLVTLAACIEE